MSLSELATFDNSVAANIVVTKLESEGITSFLHNEHFSTLLPNSSNMLGTGIRVMVPTDQLERAKAIISIERPKATCPRCDSPRIRARAGRFMLVAQAIILGLTGATDFTKYTCDNCGHRFRR
ncbi:MAG: DUF2007 domain-containing protein [Cyclobacteriaceae bacterium]